jgi:predicted enzyme related to lactoylglutathione lyase
MTSRGARPTWASRAGAESAGGRVGQPEANGGRTPVPAQDVGTIGRIATVDDPPGAELAKAGSR